MTLPGRLPSSRAAGLTNGHLQTILGNFLRRPDLLPPFTRELVEVSPATHHQISSQVLCHCHWQPESVRRDRLTVILLHGLEGSSKSQYVIGNANKMWQAGFNIVRMNMRNCGGTEALSPTLYHSGFSGDRARCHDRFCTARYGICRFALVGLLDGRQHRAQARGRTWRRHPPTIGCLAFVRRSGVSPAARSCSFGRCASIALRTACTSGSSSRALLKRFRRKAMLFPHVYDPDARRRSSTLSATSTSASPPSTPASRALTTTTTAPAAARVIDQHRCAHPDPARAGRSFRPLDAANPRPDPGQPAHHADRACPRRPLCLPRQARPSRRRRWLLGRDTPCCGSCSSMPERTP